MGARARRRDARALAARRRCHADGYLALQALAWHGTTTYDTVQIVDQGLDVASRSSSHTATPRTDRVTTGDFALSAQTTQAGVRATYTLPRGRRFVDCEGATLRSWTQRRTVTRVAEVASRRAADAQIDVDAVRHVEGVGALATAARESLSRGRGDIVSRTYFDSGTPEMEAAARLREVLRLPWIATYAAEMEALAAIR